MNMLGPQLPGASALRVGLPAGGQRRSLLLGGIPGAVARGRFFVREALQDWGWLPGAGAEQRAVGEDVLLLVSELVGNACLHAGGATELVLHCTRERLRIEVGDASTVPPALRPRRTAGQPGGHGLRIVARLAGYWGFQPRPVGKTVWAEIAAPVPTPT